MRPQYFAVLVMLASMVSSQVSATFAKQLFAVASPLTVTVFRVGFAFLMIAIIFRSWKIIPQFNTLAWKPIILYSLSLGVMNMLFYFSLSKIDLGVAVALEFVGPLSLALFSVHKRQDYLWVILAIVGIVGLVPYHQLAHFSITGAILALSAGVCWGGYIYFGKKMVQANTIGIHTLTLGLAISTLYLLPFSLYFYPDEVTNLQYWGIGVWIAFLATALPYALDLYAFKHLSQMSYGTLTSLNPALAALFGFVLLHEYLSVWQVLALGCIISASIGVTIFSKNASS